MATIYNKSSTMTLYIKSMSRTSSYLQRPSVPSWVTAWAFWEFKLIFWDSKATEQKSVMFWGKRFGNIVLLLSTEISFWSISLSTTRLTTLDLHTLRFGSVILESDSIISGHEGNLFTESLGHLVGWFASSVSKSFKTTQTNGRN